METYRHDKELKVKRADSSKQPVPQYSGLGGGGGGVFIIIFVVTVLKENV